MTKAIYDEATNWPAGFDPTETGALQAGPERDLRGADLTGTPLAWTNLSRADLRQANLGSAWLTRANLQEADLRGADLRGINVDGANLTGGIYDAHTRWNEGFDPERHGAKLAR